MCQLLDATEEADVRSPNVNTGDAAVDPRIANGYDPNAAGSYYPDPEDYPPVGDDDRPNSAGMSMLPGPGLRSSETSLPRNGSADSVHGWAGVDTELAAASPTSSASMAARRFTDSGVFAVIVAVVLGVAAVAVFAYGQAGPTRSDPPPSVVTPAATAPAGDAPAGPTAPGRLAPGDEQADSSAVPAVPDDEGRPGGDDDDGADDDGDDD